MQTSIPVFFMLYYANQQLELAANYMTRAHEMAVSFHGRALGLLLMIEGYIASGNQLSDTELEAFNKARGFQLIVNEGLNKYEHNQRAVVYENGNGRR